MDTSETADAQHRVETKDSPRVNAAIVEAATVLGARLESVAGRSEFVAKVLASSRVHCKSYEFQPWHAASDNVKNNGGDLPWGTLGSEKASQ